MWFYTISIPIVLTVFLIVLTVLFIRIVIFCYQSSYWVFGPVGAE